MPGFFEKKMFELEAFSCSIRFGLSLAKQLLSFQKIIVSSSKFTILNSSSPVFTHLIIIEMDNDFGFLINIMQMKLP